MDKILLDEIKHELNTQDNRITADPMFCVFEKERIYGIDPDYSDQYVWCDCSGEKIDEPEDEDEAENNGFHKVHYVERDRFVNAHFTERSANYHIKINGHNLRQPFVYATSLWRCPEMIEIRDAFKNGELTIDHSAPATDPPPNP